MATMLCDVCPWHGYNVPRLCMYDNMYAVVQVCAVVILIHLFIQGVSIPASAHLYPFQVGNSTFLAAAGVLQGQPATEQSLLFESVAIDPQNTDYYDR